MIPEIENVFEEQETLAQFEKSRQFFHEADLLKFDNYHVEAERKYREAMDATIDNGVYFHLAQGQIHEIHKNIEDALTEFEIASNINSNLLDVQINLGLIYRKLSSHLRSFNRNEEASRMMEESLAAFQRALAIDANSIDIHKTLAMTYLKINNNVEAEKCARKTLSIDPDSYLGLNVLAQIEKAKGQPENLAQARKLLLRAIELKPNHDFAYSLMGSLETKPAKALEWYDKALFLQPKNDYVLTEIGKIYRDKFGKASESISWFNQVIEIKGNLQHGPLTNRGNALLKANQFQEAETDLKNALAINPSYSYAIVTMRDLLKSQGRFEEALQFAQKAYQVNKNPKNDKELKEIEGKFQTDKNNSLAITSELCRIKADFRKEETLKKAHEALRLFSKNNAAWGTIGLCYAYQNNSATAKGYLQESLDINPDVFMYRQTLAVVLERLGDLPAAEREFTLLVQQRPSHNQASDGLARVKRKLQGLTVIDKFKLSEGPKLSFLNNLTGREEFHYIELIRDFLNDRMERWRLPIRDVIKDIGRDSIFIIAKTGVGKTVSVPTKVLLELCDKLIGQGANFLKKFPQVYVVEPRIPICTMMMAEMNQGYQDYIAYRMIKCQTFAEYAGKRGVADVNAQDKETVEQITALAYEFASQGLAPYKPRLFNLYGCITSQGKVNADAPILFITTGIMESLSFEGKNLDPDYNRIIIDEAHVTIEQNPAIELGIGLSTQKGVKIDYMSATVDQATLEMDLDVKIIYVGEKRFPICLTNLGDTVDNKILELVEKFLVSPKEGSFPEAESFHDPQIQKDIKRVRQHLLSEDDYREDDKAYSGLKNRPQGMLVVVSSHQDERSDTRRITDLIANADFQSQRKVYALRLASPIIRDPAQKLAFDRLINKIERENGRYVIVATNVVEMGITFSSIDYVVTMDSEFENKFVDGSSMTVKVPLGVNALYQRIGRCGRLRPGMAFIANDFGAPYTKKSDEDLMRGLEEQPIRYPLAKGSFLKLALYTYRERIPEAALRMAVTNLKLPSRIQENPLLWSKFLRERARMRQIGIAQNDALTIAGEKALTFIGLEDMDFAVLLANTIKKYGPSSSLAIIFTLFAAAAEHGFDKIVRKGFILENQNSLSAFELIQEESIDISKENAQEIIQQYGSNAMEIYKALLEAGADCQVCADIYHLIREGYRLVTKKENNESGLAEMQTEGVTAEANRQEELTGFSEIEPEIVEQQYDEEFDRSFLDPLAAAFSEHSTEKTLAFEKAAVSLNDQSELINIWRIFHYFFNKYFSLMRSRVFNTLEENEFREKMEKEAEKLQVSARTLRDLNKKFLDLCKQTKIELPKIELPLEVDQRLSDGEIKILRDNCLNELLFERTGSLKGFDLCKKLYEISGNKAWLNDSQATDALRQAGFSVSSAQVKEWWYLIIREARKRFEEKKKSFLFKESREDLPTITKKMERQILELLRENGYHRKLTLIAEKNGKGFRAFVKDEAGQETGVFFDNEKSPLSVNFFGKETVDVLAKLTPEMRSKTIKKGGPENLELSEVEEKVFAISHLTVLEPKQA